MKEIKVSVIIPVYNVENYLDASIYSMVHQNLGDLEIFIVNSDSTDNSKQIIDKYKSLYPDKIVDVHVCEHLGHGYARNIGLRYTNGEYVYFMDSDDIVKLDLLEKLYSIAKFTDINITSLRGKTVLN